MKHTLTTLTLPLLLIGFLLIGTSKQDTLLYEEIPIHHADQSLVIKGEFNEVLLKTANGCGLGNYLIAMRGDSSNGIPPRLGSVDFWNSGPFYTDTLPGKEIKGVVFKRQTWLENTSIITTQSRFYHCCHQPERTNQRNAIRLGGSG